MSVFNEDFADDETASAGTSGTYVNGYRFRRTLRIGGSAVTGATALTDLPLRFDETLPGLRSTANGGNVQSTSGWDIRFEDTSGGKLKHELEIYDPVAGRAACWVRVPSVTPGIDRDILVYYGKPGLAGPEQDVSATGTWARCLGCWRMPDGRDMTGHGRDMTSSGVTGGTIGGHPAAVLTASSYLELLDTTFMDSKSEFTPFLLFRPSSLPSGGSSIVRFGGTPTGTGKLAYTLYDQPDIAKALRNYDWLAAGTAFVIGPANSAVAGHTYTWAVPVKSGAWPVQEFDGAPVTSTQTGAIGTGLTAYPSSVLLRIGAGYGDFTACVPGAYGRFWVFDSRVPDAFVAFLDLTIRFPRACYGIGAEDSSTDADRSPVMGPVFAGVHKSSTTDISVPGSDPDGNTMTTGTEAPAAALGTTSIAAGQLRYVSGATEGVDRVGVTKTAGAKTAHALATVTVAGDGTSGGAARALAPKSERIKHWELVKRSDKAAAVVEGADEATGLRLTAGPKDVGDANDGTGCIAVVSLDQISGKGVLEFDYQPISLWADETPNTANGVFAQIGFYVRNNANTNLSSFGTQSAGEWTANYSPNDDYYSNSHVSPSRAVGLRFSIDKHNINVGGGNDISFRSIQANGTELGPFGGVKTFDFRTPGGWTHVAIALDPANDQATVTATWQGGASTTETMTDVSIGAQYGTTPKNVVLMCWNGRDAKFRNLVWTPAADDGGGGGTGAGTEGWAPDFPDVADAIQNKGWYYENVTGATLQARYNALTAAQIARGVLLLVNYGAQPGETVTGGLTLNKNGASKDKPIIIRVGGWHTNTNTFVEPDKTSGGTGFFPSSAAVRATVSWTGICNIPANFNWVRGLRWQGGATINGSSNRVNRCLFDGATANSVDNGTDNIWDWCEMVGTNGPMMLANPRLGARRNWYYRCWFHDNLDASLHNGAAIFIGTGAKDQFDKNGAPFDANFVLQDLLFENWSFYGNTLEVKGNGQKMLRCSQRKGTGDKSPLMLMRHGDNGLWAACHFGDGRLSLRGIGTVVSDCTATGTGDRGPSSGNITATDLEAYDILHIRDNPFPTSPNNYPTGEDMVFAGCDFALAIGWNNSAGTIPPSGTIVENDCSGPFNTSNGAKYQTRPRSMAVYREPDGTVKRPRMWKGGVGTDADVGTNGRYSSAQ